MKKGKDYIVISELPQKQQTPLRQWLEGQTAPVVEEEGEKRYDCCYKWDYDKWLAYYKRGRIAPVDD